MNQYINYKKYRLSLLNKLHDNSSSDANPHLAPENSITVYGRSHPGGNPEPLPVTRESIDKNRLAFSPNATFTEHPSEVGLLRQNIDEVLHNLRYVENNDGSPVAKSSKPSLRLHSTANPIHVPFESGTYTRHQDKASPAHTYSHSHNGHMVDSHLHSIASEYAGSVVHSFFDKYLTDKHSIHSPLPGMDDLIDMGHHRLPYMVPGDSPFHASKVGIRSSPNTPTALITAKLAGIMGHRTSGLYKDYMRNGSADDQSFADYVRDQGPKKSKPEDSMRELILHKMLLHVLDGHHLPER